MGDDDFIKIADRSARRGFFVHAAQSGLAARWSQWLATPPSVGCGSPRHPLSGRGLQGHLSRWFVAPRPMADSPGTVTPTMQPVRDTPGRVRFGIFEVDLRTGELRKRGVRVRLQEQPFQVLAALLATPGDLVTREELQSRVWTTDTFVDFDHGLNKAVNKIREALADSA